MSEDVIFDEPRDDSSEDSLFTEEEKEEVERIIWDEDGINEKFDREAF